MHILCSKNQGTALHVAAQYGRDLAVKCLINRGAKVNATRQVMFW